MQSIADNLLIHVFVLKLRIKKSKFILRFYKKNKICNQLF